MKFLIKSAKKVYAVIKIIGETVAKIVNFILLVILYFVGIGLTSIIVKLFGKEFLLLKKPNTKSYWIENKITKKKLTEYYRSF